MKIKQTIVFFTTLLIAGSSLANLKTSNITLTGGTINPHETLTISLTPLLPNVSYKIVTKITDTNNKKNKVYLKAGQFDNGSYSYCFITVNGSFIAGSQFVLDRVDNTVEFSNLYGSGPISITNLDDTDSVTVTAYATPEVFG